MPDITVQSGAAAVNKTVFGFRAIGVKWKKKQVDR